MYLYIGAKIDERTEDRKAQQYIEESKTSYLKDLSYWGDGVKTGFEVWDDGNNISGDGCNADWSEIEQGFIWSTDGALKEVCLSCPYGFYPNNSKDMWITIWGDGIVEGNEEWDDSNTINKDGCDSKWNLEKEITNLKVTNKTINILVVFY